MFQCQQVDNLIDIENTRMCYTVYILIMYLYDCCNNFNINSNISIIILSIIYLSTMWTYWRWFWPTESS